MYNVESHSKSAKIQWEEKKQKKNKILKTATMTLFPHSNSRLHLGIMSHFALWNKPIQGLELFQFATISPVLPTRANTLDRSRHFEPGTFLNRRHYCDV